MKKENMLKLADFLDNLPEFRFDIGYWIAEYDENLDDYCNGHIIDLEDCNTAGCIAGWACALMNDNSYEVEFDHYTEEYEYQSVEDEAAYFLGLESYEARRLFIPNENSVWAKYAEDYGIVFHDYGTKANGIPVKYLRDTRQIHPKYVADMLHRIVSGEVEL